MKLTQSRLSYTGRADSRFVPSQWVMALLCNAISYWLEALLCNAISYWLDPNLESALTGKMTSLYWISTLLLVGLFSQESDASCGHSPTKIQNKATKELTLENSWGEPQILKENQINHVKMHDKFNSWYCLFGRLIHWPQDKMANILQKTFPNAFSRKKRLVLIHVENIAKCIF